MKLTIFLLTVGFLHVSAGARAQQKLSLSVKNERLEKVFALIKKQTGYAFFYDIEIIKDTKKITLDVKNATLEELLTICLKGQSLDYNIINNTISIVKKKEPQPVVIKPVEVENDIHGRVTDSLGNPLIGASVVEKKSLYGTTTDANGNFNLKNVDNNITVIVSFTGYLSREIKINNQNVSHIVLLRYNNPLDEVQIIAYGTTTQRLNTGNIATVKAEDIAKQPVSNPLLALEGRVPGLFVTQASGFAGSGVTVRIQGMNSIGGGNDPLYVVDGVPYSSQLLPEISTTLGSSGGLLVNHSITYGNPLSFINPADIESIAVLKDADATAIYGSRAANGAILITTKKGKAGEQRVEFNFQQGWGQVARRMKMLNLRQYLDMRYEALNNDGIDLSTASTTNPNFYDLKVWDTTRYTDWQKELIGNTSQYTDLQTTVSGGNANTLYTIGAGYHRETSVMPGDFKDQRGSLHFQINSTSSNQRFRVRLIGSYLADNNQLPHNVAGGTDLTAMALQLAPDAPALYKPDGTINWAPDASGNSTWDYPGNPLAQLLNKYQNKTSNLVGNALLSFQILPGFYLKSSFGYTNLQTNETVTVPLTSTAPELRQNTTRIGIYGISNTNSWIIEPQVSYDLIISKGKLGILMGSTIQENNSDGQRLYGSGYTSDEAIDDISNASSVQAAPGIKLNYRYTGIFGRVNYNWQNKYILDLNARRDGSSRFGAQNQFHNFGSIGAAWVFSEENFTKERFSVLSFGKFKLSYGTTGNDQIGDYQYLSLYNPVNSGVPYQGINTLQPNSLANPYLQWEETRKLFFGLDLGFFKDRITINTNYFDNRSSNQLLGYQLPVTTGFNSVITNFPATVQNMGWEFSLTTINIQTTKIKWSTTINLTIPENKLLAFPGIQTSTYANTLVVGEPITLVKRFNLLGVDPSTGVYYFNSKTNPNNPIAPDDANVLINTSPIFYGGLQNSVGFAGFQLDFLFQFVKQNGPNYFFGRFPGQSRINQPIYLLDRWQYPGDISSHQRYNSDLSISGPWLNASTSSDAAFSDASYVRLKNISLSWQLPERMLKNIHLHDLRVYALGQNLLTITHYKGLDPETLSSTSLPPLRVLTIGFQLTM